MGMAAEPLPQPTFLGRRDLFGHPIGLYVLSLSEMGERFCHYGMRALLVLYLAKHLVTAHDASNVRGFASLRAGIEHVYGLQDNVQLADQVYGIYAALAYLTPLFGGILADRVLGQRRCAVLGGVILAAGEFLLMKDSLFLLGLGALIVGNGCFKSNVSAQVGALYSPGDPRRDRAYGIAYMGINVGAWSSPLVCGTLGQRLGWAWGFGSAGVGMLLALVVYLGGQRYLPPDRASEQRSAVVARPGAGRRPSFNRDERARIRALVVLTLLGIPFCAALDQQSNSLQFWADARTDLRVLGWAGIDWEMPSTWFQSFNPAFILLLTPIVNRLWTRQAKYKVEPSSVTKMAIGCFLLGASFVLMIGADRATSSGGQASVLWLVAGAVVLTLGEIYVAPVGLSLVTKLAPPASVSMLMGMWFLSDFFGNYLSGVLASLAPTMTGARFFLLLAAVASAPGILMLLLRTPLVGRRGWGLLDIDGEARPTAD